MSEQTLHSDAQAALIEAHRQAHALEQRYQYLREETVDDEGLRNVLDDRQRSLAGLRRDLKGRLDAHDLLPHDVNVDLEDLTRLADRFRKWLDDERHDPLRKALAGQEQALLDALRDLPEDERTGLSEAIEQTRSAIEQLDADAD